MPRNLPRWCTQQMLSALRPDGATALGRELRAGMSQLSPAALNDLRASFPRESGLAAENRTQRLAELDQAEAELERARNEIEVRRAALRADQEND